MPYRFEDDSLAFCSGLGPLRGELRFAIVANENLQIKRLIRCKGWH